MIAFRFSSLDPRRGGARPWLVVALILTPLVALGVAGQASGDRVQNPHGNFRGACSDCHTEDRWTPIKANARRNHARRGFPLEGAHAALDCKSCHGTLDFAQSSRLCASCHEDPHRGELGGDCARCHGSRSFLDPGVMRRQHQLTSFPLTGSHAGLDCESCHPPAPSGRMQFLATRAACDQCHMDQYRAARDPDHVAGHFPLDCAQCHKPISWSNARFDHSLTRFPLTGAHATTACASCHGDAVYAGKSTACASCHQADYNGTTDPNHAAAGYSTQCQTCHGTASWAGAGFDHSTTGFPLTGAHATTACASCHGDGVFAGKSTACAACHQADYDGTTNPNHTAANFTTQCQTCHTTVTWAGATFDHDASFFPIYSGTHNNRWSQCSECHNVPASFAQFTCISCHPHSDQAGTDSHHTGVSGYRYDSQACYSCHPRGRAG